MNDKLNAQIIGTALPYDNNRMARYLHGLSCGPWTDLLTGKEIKDVTPPKEIEDKG